MDASFRDPERHMTHDELLEYEPETLELDEEAEEWDEETLGLDWNEADAQSVVREVIPTRGFGD
jgi:hypothetical protein